MKKILALITVLVLGITIFTACGNNSKKDKEDTKKLNSLERVKKDGVLTMGLNDTYPPMEFRDENHKLVGFDIDLDRKLVKN